MKTIVVIEDNKMNMKLILTLLTKQGYQVMGAEDAEAGLEMILLQHPDLVLMDIQLPGMDGLEATRRLKIDPKLAHIPVLALTALAMDGDKEKALAAGCEGYLSKPLQYKVLLATLKKIFTEGEASHNNA